jgi:predicted transcriptional regulator
MERVSEDNLWKLYGYVVSSEYRKVIIKLLLEKPSTPKFMAQRSNKPQSHISRALKELENKGIVKCVNPDAKKGRIYRLTDLGVKIAKMFSGQK